LSLCSSVPHGQVKDYTWEEGSFADTQEQSNNEEACQVLADALKNSDNAEDEGTSWQEYPGTHLTQNDVKRNLEQDISEEEQGKAGQVLVVCDLEISSQTVNLGVGDFIAR